MQPIRHDHIFQVAPCGRQGVAVASTGSTEDFDPKRQNAVSLGSVILNVVHVDVDRFRRVQTNSHRVISTT